jgi:hypothetical protein
MVGRNYAMNLPRSRGIHWLLLVMFALLNSAALWAAPPTTPPEGNSLQASKPQVIARFVIHARGKYGFINAAGKVVIPPQFESATGFEDGLARVEVVPGSTIAGVTATGRYGWLKPDGRWAIPPIHAYAKDFSQGRAAVRCLDNDRYGYLSSTGQLVIPCQYLRAEPFHDGLAAVEVSRDQWGFLDPSGQVVFAVPWADLDDPPHFAQGLVPLRDQKTRLIRYVDKLGRVVLDTPYRHAGHFAQGLAPFLDPKTDKWGYHDTTGKVVIAPQFDRALAFHEDLAAVQAGQLWGYIDRTGKWLLPATWASADVFSEGLARVQLAGKYGYIDKTGKVVIALVYDSPMHYRERFAGGLVLAANKSKDDRLLWLWLDKKGRVVWQER